MDPLNDSHVFTFHSSIFDYSKLFGVPIQFEWIEEKVIITAIDNSVDADLNIGDEIISIDGLSINEILENESDTKEKELQKVDIDSKKKMVIDSELSQRIEEQKDPIKFDEDEELDAIPYYRKD